MASPLMLKTWIYSDFGKRNRYYLLLSFYGELFGDYEMVMTRSSKRKASELHCDALFFSSEDPSKWRKKFLALGCNKVALDKVMSSKAINNYKKLYETMDKINPDIIGSIPAWAICCLSGEIPVLMWAEQNEDLGRHSEAIGKNPLHFSAWGGSLEAIQYCMEKFEISPKSEDGGGFNVLYYAALSDSDNAVLFLMKSGCELKAGAHIDTESCFDHDFYSVPCSAKMMSLLGITPSSSRESSPSM